ncbi:MAG: helicase-exonuclease AddAB subunit AddA [Clostridia bacterium]|nr:helicase-exonuclease AddAB subunit AddA [Clostridia bacterium]
MSIQWTSQQRDAIYSYGGSILVSAGAGSGKTAVLVQRVIEKITRAESPVPIDKLLIVTYTRAAASEMRERISNKLDELISQKPQNIALLKEQKLKLSHAYISTVHSFCLDMIRDNFTLLDITPGFRMGDDSELEIIKNDAITEVLEQFYEERSSAFDDLSACFSGSRDDKPLQNMVLSLYEFLRSHPFPDEWLSEQMSVYGGNKAFSDMKQVRFLLDYAREAADFCINIAQSSAEDLRLTEETNFTRERPNYRDPKATAKLKRVPPLEIAEYNLAFAQDLKQSISNGWDSTCDYLKKFQKDTMYSHADFNKTPAYLNFKTNRDFYNEAIKKLSETFDRSEHDCRDDMAKAYPIVDQLFKIVLAFDQKFTEMKREKNILDFSDLEHLAIELLIKKSPDGEIEFSDIAKGFSSELDEVMVDEYQDANEVQNMIFRALSDDEKKLFVVGDVKQSIYRFRQAMPEIFMRKSESYDIYNGDSPSYPAKILLNRNFRSNKGILDSVNFVFSQIMSKQAGEIDYDENEYLLTDKEDTSSTPAVEYVLIEKGESEEKNDVLEARQIAEIILDQMSNHYITDKRGTKVRPMYGDFAVLLRSTSQHAPTFVDELLKLGIPATSNTKNGFFDCREVMLVMSLLRVIDNPMQDIPLISIMMSPLYGFTPDDIARYRCNYPNDNIYNMLCKEAENEELANYFLSEIKEFRSYAASMHTDELINAIYEKKSMRSIIGAMGNSDIRINNINLLREYASSYEKNGFKGLNGFIRFMDKLSQSGKDLFGATASSNDASNCVKVMSIHSSKGLEFPICIIAGLGRKFNSDSKAIMQIHPEMGIGFKQSLNIKNCRYDTMMRKAVSKCVASGERSEELRVLYVAMTRAKEKLYFIHTNTSFESSINKAYSQLLCFDDIPPYLVRNAVCIGDWMLLCALKLQCGRELVKRYFDDDEIYNHISNVKWNVKFVETMQNENESADTAQPNEEISVAQPDEELLEKLRERFEFKYKYDDITYLPVKYSVSALTKGNINISDNEYALTDSPAFLTDDGLTAAQRGTALHSFMQYADFYRASSDSVSELERLVSQEFITEAQAKAVNLEKVDCFFDSELGRRMLASKSIYREYRFAMIMKLSEIFNSEYSNDEETLIQGAIDCAFEENGEIVIIDYKTDNISDMAELSSRYSAQLKMYKLAMEKCTGKKVKELWLYSFKKNDKIRV